jgi:hypothetical protein
MKDACDSHVLKFCAMGRGAFKKKVSCIPLHVGPNLWGREGVSDTSSHSEMDTVVLEITIRLSIIANLNSVWGVLDTRIQTQPYCLLET